MAPCGITCGLSSLFLVSMIFMNYSIWDSQIMQKYRNQLPESLQNTYREILNERTRIYYFGYFLGFILSLIIILYNTQISKNKMGNLGMVCLVVAVSFIVNYFYYILSPKSKWMLNEIKTEHQTKAWLEMYRHMQIYYHSGLVLGIIATGLFAYSFRCM
jgi:uncharacterized membrane protein YkgB